ncbi:MAG: hypothetical protein ACK5RO_03075 [Pseudobdellovibrionaceae bacterium]|jgi:hypothetical protein
MKNYNKLILATMVVGLSVGCAKKNDSETSVDPVEATLESGISVISGMADDQAGSSFAKSEATIPSIWDALLPQKAIASGSCTRAVLSSCSSSQRRAVHSSCQLGSSLVTLSGEVTLTYSQASCLLSGAGDSVVRSYDLEYEGPRGATLNLSSAIQSDYRGTSFGGGGRLTRTASGYDLDVLGRHSRLVGPRGGEIYDLSVRTLSPLGISGGLSRSSRTVNGGSLEVNHNLAGFTAVFTPSNLQWSASCCHPISGSMTVNYSGSKMGSATVSFNGCGSAEVNQDGQTQTVEFSYCE